MTSLEMIAEWRKGCSVSEMDMDTDLHPYNCRECTLGLIDALERRLRETLFQRIVRTCTVLWSKYVRRQS